jgi:solute:Na+ symporter, SSS family
MKLLAIDYAMVIAYLGGMMALGLYLSRRVDSSEDYFLGGRMLPFWAVGISIVASDIGAFDMVGLSGQAFRNGISVANFDWIGSFPAMVIAAFLFIPFFWRSRVTTIPEFLGRRYNVGVRTVQAIIWIVFNVANLAITFYAVVLLMDEFLGWGYWPSIIAAGTVIGIYTISGGLTAIVLTDIAQVVIMYTGCIAIIILGLWEVGGPSGLKEKILAMGPAQQEHFSLLRPANTEAGYPWPGILFGLGMVMAPAYFTGNQTIVQRALGARDEWNAKASMLVGALLKTLVPIFVVTPGLIALALYSGEIQDGDRAFPTLIRKLLPPGMSGLMFAAFLAAMMSNLDSIMNSTATLFTKDLYQRFARKAASDRELLVVGRIATFVVLVGGIATSTYAGRHQEGVYALMQTLLSCFQGPTFAILILGMLWHRCTPTAGLTGLLTGLAGALAMTWYAESLFRSSAGFLYVAFWSFALTILVCAVVTPFTRPLDEESLRDLVYRA